MSKPDAALRKQISDRRPIVASLEAPVRAAQVNDWTSAAYVALLGVLDEHKPFLAELTSDGDTVGYQCMGCGPVEDYGAVAYPCNTVKKIAGAFGVEVEHA